jgi:cobalamin biosynthesis Mg chelatase CobN
MPTTASPIQELAYGANGQAGGDYDALAGLEATTPEDVLAPATTQVAAKAQPKVTTQRHARAVVADATQPVAAQPAAAVESPIAVEAQPALLASNDQDSRYAQREAQASQQQEFRGGDAIVISAGALVVVLLIVILVLLLR